MSRKHYLLSWYGITDLRAAMGFDFQGPVFGALKTGHFDSAIILAYSKSKDWTPEQYAEQEKAIEELNTYTGDKSTAPREASLRFIDALANTPSGHRFYREWLTGQLAQAGISTEIVMHECFLKELNDTEGIYFSAVRALQEVRKNEAASITAYLSPGTPVMAFSWALALLAFPQLNVKLIVSPDFRKGVKEISIPAPFLEHIAGGQSAAK